MKYIKKENDNYNLHIIQTDRFKTITVKVNLKRPLIKEEITKRNLLVNALLEGTKNYPSKRLLEIKTEELYDLGYRGVNYASGKFTMLSFEMTFINPKYTELGIEDESFKFLKELIFHPNVENDAIAPKNFNMAYNTMEDYLTTLNENTSTYSQMRMLEEMDDSIISYRSAGYLEDLVKINAKDLYEYYLNIINNDVVDIFIIGDIEENKAIDLVSKYLPFKTNKKSCESHFYNHEYVTDEIKFTSEKVDKNQSKLVLGFKMEELTDFEKRYVLSVYNYILGGSTESNLFQTIREKYSLCYYITSMSLPLLSVSLIKAGINALDYEETLSLINQELNKMKQGEFEESKIENAKTTYINGLTELEDSPDNIISLYAGIEYLGSDNIEDRKDNIMKVTKEDIVKLASKIHLNTIYLLEGSDEYEED